MESNCHRLRISTYNIQNIANCYSERKIHLKQILSKLDSDILGLQEVSFLEPNQLPEIFEANLLEKYRFFFAKSQLNFSKVHNLGKNEFNIDGNVLCVKKSLFGSLFEESGEKEDILHLSPERAINILELKIKGSEEKVIFVNVHLHTFKDAPCHDAIRSHQIFYVKRIIEEKFENSKKGVAFWFGDFNLFPSDFTYGQIMDSGFLSVFKEVKGREPQKTWPVSDMIPEDEPDYPGCIDYIFVRSFDSQLEILTEGCGMEGNSPINVKEEEKGEKGLFPSDHVALFADFKVKR